MSMLTRNIIKASMPSIKTNGIFRSICCHQEIPSSWSEQVSNSNFKIGHSFSRRHWGLSYHAPYQHRLFSVSSYSRSQQSDLPDDNKKWEVGEENSDEFSFQTNNSQYINTKRGKEGVFDIGELVEILKNENGYDVCVISVSEEMNYVDYLVIVTARSRKHLKSLATHVRFLFKQKNRKPTDVLPGIEGGKSLNSVDEWLALDLGNIALHIFLENKRIELDLETLWTVGPEFDEVSRMKDPDILNLLGDFNNVSLPNR